MQGHEGVQVSFTSRQSLHAGETPVSVTDEGHAIVTCVRWRQVAGCCEGRRGICMSGCFRFMDFCSWSEAHTVANLMACCLSGHMARKTQAYSIVEVISGDVTLRVHTKYCKQELHILWKRLTAAASRCYAISGHRPPSAGACSAGKRRVVEAHIRIHDHQVNCGMSQNRVHHLGCHG